MAMNPTIKQTLIKLGIEIGCVVAALVGKRVIEKAEEHRAKIQAEKEADHQLIEHN